MQLGCLVWATFLLIPIIAYKKIIDNEKYVFHVHSGFLAHSSYPTFPKACEDLLYANEMNSVWGFLESLPGWLVANRTDNVVRRGVLSAPLSESQEGAG